MLDADLAAFTTLRAMMGSARPELLARLTGAVKYFVAPDEAR